MKGFLLDQFDNEDQPAAQAEIRLHSPDNEPDREQRLIAPLPWKPFPVECLPRMLADYVRGVAVSIGCDVTYAVLPLLSLLAACIGRSRELEVKPGWWEPCILWTAFIGESGSGKSPAFKSILRPLRKLEDTMLQEYRADCNRILTTHEESGGKKNEQPEMPPMPRYLVADTTIEALGPVLLDNPLGLLLADDELSGWLASFNQYKSGKGSDRSKWLQTYDAGRLVIDRKTGIRTQIIPHASISITGGIQPGVLRKSFSDDDFDSGLPARFLFAMPPDKITGWSDAIMPDDGPYQQVLEQLINGRTMNSLLGFDDSPLPDDIHKIKLTDQARKVIASFKDDEKTRLQGITGPLRSCWAKSAGRAARIALILHCVESPDLETVSGDVMERAVTMAEWFDRETARIYQALGVCTAPDAELLDFIRENQPVSAYDVHRWKQTRFKDTETAERYLLTLCEQGLLTVETVATGGRPKTVFRTKTVSD